MILDIPITASLATEEWWDEELGLAVEVTTWTWTNEKGQRFEVTLKMWE